MNMLPCAYKSLFGIDCPLCGAQRSLSLLLNGKLIESFKMYPPLVPVLLCAILFIVHLLNKKTISAGTMRSFSVIVLALVVINYAAKLATGDY